MLRRRAHRPDRVVSTRRPVAVVAVAVASAVAMAACSGDEPTTNGDPAASDPGGSAAPGATGGDSGGSDGSDGSDGSMAPIEVDDCGGTTRVTARVERAVALDQGAAELLVWLGLRSRVAGVVLYEDADARWPSTSGQMAFLQVLNDLTTAAPADAIAAVEPDLLVVADATAVGDDLPERSDLESLGVPLHVGTSTCAGTSGGDGATDALTGWYDDVRDLGLLFDVQLRAEAVVSQVQADIARLAGGLDPAAVGALTVWATDGGDDLRTFGGAGMVDALLGTVGATNAFDDLDDLAGTGAPVAATDVADRDPDVLWLVLPAGTVDLAGAADDVLARFAADPVLSQVTAVREGAVVVSSVHDVAPSPRVVEGVTQLVAGLTLASP